MIVYRYLSGGELKLFLNNKTQDIGSTYNAKMPQNTHRYKAGVKYLHFFKNLRDFPVIQKEFKNNDGKFLCKFDIPLRMLYTKKGIGYYDGLEGGYDFGCEKIKEFAVETRKIKAEYLIDFIYDQHCDLSVNEIKEQFEEQAETEDVQKNME